MAPKGNGVPKDSEAIVDLLRQATSIGVVSSFLRAKGFPHSAGSWELLYRRRILPALIDGQLSRDDLIQLLRSVEECGRQHVFLYKTAAAKASSLIDDAHVIAALDASGLKGVLSSPDVVALPKQPTIVDVRWEGTNGSRCLIVKIVEERKSQRYLGDEHEGQFYLRRYQEISERAVNVIRLHANGLVEVRIAAHSNSGDYTNDVNALWKLIAKLVPRVDCSEVSLQMAKQRLWKDRETLSHAIRFSDSTLRNEKGTILRAATGSTESDLYSDDRAVKSLDTFFTREAECDSQNFWFKARNGLERDIHVRIAGQVNEFAVTAKCSVQEYEFVLRELRSLNR
jgi:hypothetical protein